MGSRRAKRSHGRVQPAFSRPRRDHVGSASRLIKKSVRLQHKAAILTAARSARRAAHEKPPLLLAMLSVSGATDDELNRLASVMRATELASGTRPFETTIIRRGHGDKRETLIAALDAAKVADILLLVFSNRDDIDTDAVTLLDAIRAQGLPTVFSIAVGQGAGDAALRKLRGRQLAAESLGEDHSLRPIWFDLFSKSDRDSVNRMAMRRLFAKEPREISWRSRYGYMLVESARLENVRSEGDTTLSLCGWVRGRGFSANELLHLTGIGSFAVAKVSDARSGEVLSVRDQRGEPVEMEAEVDTMMGEQTWPPEVGEAEEGVEENEEEDMGKVLARHYDATAEENDRLQSDDDGEIMADDEQDDGGLGETDHDGMEVDAEEVKRVREEARIDAEFPDEVDTPIDKPARVRFARYRGLKSLRTGEWDAKEQLPREYAKLFQFRNLAATRKRVLENAKRDAAEAAKSPKTNFAGCGKKVHIQLLHVPKPLQEAVFKKLQSGRLPLVASGMLRHENRKSVVHFALQRVDSDQEGSEVKAKMHLEMHCGFVRFEGRPMFSENNANSDKHKMERFLTHGRYTVASFYGPAIFAPAPALLCRPNGGLIATGSALGADPDRIILKRIVLTGYPFKTQKRRTVAKFMFFNPEDVRWFKPVELWTKLGRSGHILEPVGTHGHMKCIFDGVIMHHDTVCMTLYKRVYPKLVCQEDEHRQALDGA